jgi:hypothetical protein
MEDEIAGEAQYVLPEPMRVGSFLMKTASTFNQPGEALHSRFQ